MLLTLALLATACSGDEEADVSSSTSGPTTTEAVVEQSTPGALPTDGNRVVEGTGGALAPFVTSGRGVDPEWVVAATNPAGFIVALTAAEGTTRSWVVAPPESAPFESLTIPAGGPPLMINEGVVLVPPADASPLTSPVALSEGTLAWIATDGSLKLRTGGEESTVSIEALPDSRVLVDDRNRILVLTGPTDRYVHAVLGDGLEATGWAIIEDGDARVVTPLDGDDVIEGTSAIWVDVDGDGEREVIVTVSNSSDGAAVRIYSEDGDLEYAGPPIGQGNRWRHQIAWADFGAGRPQLALVTTPHIGGIVELYDLSPDGTLVPNATKAGYTSHRLGSRNLDGALAGDFDGDGTVELVVTTQNREAVVGLISRTEEIVEAWRLEMPSPVVANPTAVIAGSGELVLVVVTDDGAVRTYWPEPLVENPDA